MSLLYNPFVISFTVLLLIDRVLSNNLEFDQIVDLKNSGGIGCILSIHTNVEECKTKYTQRVKNVKELGFSMDSEEYRKEFCCGFWSLRDCVADSARQKCDTKSARDISNKKIFATEHENVFYKNCDGYEYGTKQCGTASSIHISLWTLTFALFFSFLNRR